MYRRRGVQILCVALLILAPGGAIAQEATRESPRQRKQGRESIQERVAEGEAAGVSLDEVRAPKSLRVYAIKSQAVDEVLLVISQLLDRSEYDVRITRLPATQAMGGHTRPGKIVAQATAAGHDRIAELLDVIDQPAESQALTKILHPRKSQVTDLAKMVSQLPGGERLRVAIDRRTNSLILSGSKQELEVVEELIETLDSLDGTHEPSAPDEVERDWLVRLVWLIDGDDDAGRTLPDDLKTNLQPVLVELKKYGFTKLKLGSQVFVQVTPNGRFDAQGNASLGEQPYRLTLEGELADAKQGSSTLQVSIAAQEIPAVPVVGRGGFAGPSGANASLTATVRTRPGHFVVLGVTPMKDWSSVFVLQVIESK